MASFLRPRWVRLRPGSSQVCTQTRDISSRPPLRQGQKDQVKGDAQGGEEGGGDEYEAWIQSEGRKWQYPDPLGPKWLGGNVPFPRNPTFKPPIPLSDNLRQIIYSSHVNNPITNDPHTLSTRYGVSVQRIEAIVRLKRLEAQWQENIPLQTGFRKGMERILGVHAGHERPISQEINSSNRNNVNEADEMSRLANEDGARKRGLNRTFFEAVDEGQEAVVPRLMDEHREKAAAAKAKRTEYPTIVVQPNPLKPAFRFVDVGLRWFDSKDVERRQKESVRRRAIKAGKRTVKLASMSPP